MRRIQFQSTRPSRGATHLLQFLQQQMQISIHAPLAGRDELRRFRGGAVSHFNPRAPRGARRRLSAALKRGSNFNPRAPRGARRYLTAEPLWSEGFQSTRPSRGATVFYKKIYRQQGISIHAPLAGRDKRFTCLRVRIIDFNPRAPRGARRKRVPILLVMSYFNPRAPRGARRRAGLLRPSELGISIHAPLAGRD